MHKETHKESICAALPLEAREGASYCLDVHTPNELHEKASANASAPALHSIVLFCIPNNKNALLPLHSVLNP